MSDSEPPVVWRNLYGRRHGKTLRQSQKSFLGEGLEALRLRGVSPAENPERVPLELPAILGPGRDVWLEIGFGGGEHLAALAQAHPQVGFIGAEPFVNGVAMAVGKLLASGAGNVRIHPGDARDLLDVLPPGSIGRVFLNYPDPWPKRRHRRRRFVSAEFLLPLARAMAAGAELRIATDIPDYARQARVEVPKAGLRLLGDGPQPWEGWVTTRYEQKALREGRVPCYLVFGRS